jgi:hypothetical protein
VNTRLFDGMAPFIFRSKQRVIIPCGGSRPSRQARLPLPPWSDLFPSLTCRP